MNLIDLSAHRRQSQGETTPDNLVASLAALPYDISEMAIVFTFSIDGAKRLGLAHTAMNETDLVYMLERAKHEVLNDER